MKNQNLMSDFTRTISEGTKTVKIVHLDKITKELISEFTYKHDELLHGKWEHGEKDLHVKTIDSYTAKEYFNSNK